MFSIPRHAKGNYDWNALADGRYYVEWYVGGTRRRVSAGVTAAQAIEVKRRKHHELQGRKLGIPGFETAGSIYQGVVCFADRQWAQRDSWPEARRSSHEALATIRTRDPLSGARLRSIEQSGNSSKPGAVRFDDVLDALGKRDEWDKLNFFLQLPKRSSEFFNAFQSSGICESRHVLHELVFCQIAATSVNPRVVQFTLRYVF